MIENLYYKMASDYDSQGTGRAAELPSREVFALLAIANELRALREQMAVLYSAWADERRVPINAATPDDDEGELGILQRREA